MVQIKTWNHGLDDANELYTYSKKAVASYLAQLHPPSNLCHAKQLLLLMLMAGVLFGA